jgi:hypothetical protein
MGLMSWKNAFAPFDKRGDRRHSCLKAEMGFIMAAR